MSIPQQQNAELSTKNILDIMSQVQQMDKVQALLKLLEISEKEINMVGETYKILNLELITEYTGAKTTKFMVKNETWRKSVQEVFHRKDINDEKLVGFMDTQIILKMISHRRKRAHEIVNALKNEVAGTEVIPQNTKKKKFFGVL